MASSIEKSESIASISAVDPPIDPFMSNSEEKLVNGIDEQSTATENTSVKRKRSIKKPVETTESMPNGRSKRILSKRKSTLKSD